MRPRYFSMFCTTSLSWRSSRFLTWNELVIVLLHSSCLTTTADKAASSSCWIPSSSSKLTWMKKITFPHLFLIDHYLCVTSLEHTCVPRALRCLNLLQLQRTIFELHRFTLATDLNKVVTRSGVWGPHSVRKIRFLETHLARLSPTLSFSRSWHKTFFVFRHFTAVCYHRLISLWFSRASNGLEAKWSPDTSTLSLRKISERNANYFWKNYLLAWRAFGSNYKTRVKTEWVIITYYINILLPRRKFFTSLSQKTC